MPPQVFWTRYRTIHLGVNRWVAAGMSALATTVPITWPLRSEMYASYSQPMISTSCQSSSSMPATSLRTIESEWSRLSGRTSSVSSSIRSNRNGMAECRALHWATSSIR